MHTKKVYDAAALCTCDTQGWSCCKRHYPQAKKPHRHHREEVVEQPNFQWEVPKSLLPLILGMKHSSVHDYVIPGLTSSLVGGSGKGCVRMFEQGRHHEEPITPHNHRFDFCCLVIKGRVKNRIWTVDPNNNDADTYRPLRLNHHGTFGSYDIVPMDDEQTGFTVKETLYNEGEWYSMTHEQYHSIFFSKGAVVLFIEGPNISNFSHVLEPVSGDRIIPTFTVEPWMFRREDK